MIKIKNYTIEILISILAIVLLFYSSNPVFYSDSVKYLENESFDVPPLYPSIIMIMQSIFATLNSVVMLQTFFMTFGIVFFTKTASKYFNLDIPTKILVALFLFLPIIKFYNHILTEPFGYAFSLLFVSFVVRLIYNFNIPNLVWITIFVVVLLLTRNQFIFLYPVTLLLYLGMSISHSSKKTFALLIISFLSIILIHNSLSSLNKYKKKNSIENQTLFNSNSGAFNFIYIDAIYISTIQDIEIFKDDDLKKALAKIFKETHDQKALLEHYDGRGHYGYSFPIILIESHSLLKDLGIQKNTSRAKLKKEISIKLIKANFKEYVKLLFKKFYDSTWLFIFVPFFMMLASFPVFLKQKSNFSLLIIFISTFSVANHSIIYLFGRVQPRYFIYTDFILLIFFFIFFNIFLKKK